MSKIFAIHQPNYIPWIGYFYKILHSDFFVLLDAVQVPRGQSFANRNRILGTQGPFFLTIPLNKKKFHEGKFTYQQADYASDEWKKNHLKSIYLTYKKSPFFDSVYPTIESLILKDTTFCELNISLIEWICSSLNIPTSKLIRLSEILVQIREKNDLIMDIARALNASVYLCGRGGGLEYTNPSLLKSEAGLDVIYSNFKIEPYPQFNSPRFIPHLSIIDYLFNCGFKNPFHNSPPPSV